MAGSLARVRHDNAWVVVAEAPGCRRAGTSGQAAEQRERPSCLTPEDREAIRSLAETRSLRDIEADFGVSGETVRRVLQEAEAAVA